MEAATSTTPAGAAGATAADHELAVRLGALILFALGSDGGAVVRAIDETGLGLVQFKTLIVLAADDGDEDAQVKQLAERIGVSVPSASRSVDELVRRKLATRTEDPDDRRVRRVALTASGRELADTVMAARVAGLERFASTLTAAERRKLEAAVDVLMKRDEISAVYTSHAARLEERQ